jgi:hypothetical protein
MRSKGSEFCFVREGAQSVQTVLGVRQGAKLPENTHTRAREVLLHDLSPVRFSLQKAVNVTQLEQQFQINGRNNGQVMLINSCCQRLVSTVIGRTIITT